VGAAVAATGYSHRRVIVLFREAVGLAPKAFCRVRRFHRMLEMFRARPATPWAELALAAGYADQAHFSREFHGFASLTPAAYRRAAPAGGRHVPLGPRWGEVNFMQDRGARHDDDPSRRFR
jgi:AraC-like DNA-binding protein